MRLRLGVLAVCLGAMTPPAGWAQAAKSVVATAPAAAAEQPDAHRTREELSRILDRCPPALRGVLALDPGLLSNPAYLAPYPALVTYLSSHPEIVRNPSFYVGGGTGSRFSQDRASRVMELWQDVLQALAVFAGFGMAIGLLVWLIRTLVDYRRWSRLAKVQADVHAKLLDRFTSNADVLAYVESPAGSSFLQSAPINLDAGSRSVAAPLGRILWSVQGGLVLMAAGVGLMVVSGRVVDAEAAQPLNALGVLGIALGLGFLISAIISFVISRRLGLIEPARRAEPPDAQEPGTRP